jgi:hypothetical protein
MKILAAACRVIVKRPFIIWFFGIIALVWSVIDFYNPVTPILLGFSDMGKGSGFAAIVSLLQFILDPGIIITVLLFVLGFSAAAALLGGVLFSGYFFILNNTLDGKEKYKGEFIQGVKKYFSRLATIIFRTVILGFIFVVFLLIASVPAIIITRASPADSLKFVITGIFVNVLTVSVLYFGLMFFRIYFLFWYPAAVNNSKKPFLAGKRAADRAFWKVFGVMAGFDAVFAIFQIIFLSMGASAAVIPIKWAFRSFFYPVLLTYIFAIYKEYMHKGNGQADISQ